MTNTGRKWRLLMSADTVGGVWTYATELATALRPHAHVHIAALGRPCSPAQRAAARRAGCRVYESSHKLEWMEDPWRDVDEAGAWLLRLERTIQPDLIHLNHYAHSALPWSAPVLTVGHSDVYSWWNAVHGCNPPDSWRKYHNCVRKGLQTSDFVVAPSAAMLQALETHYGPFLDASVIHNGLAMPMPVAPKQPIILSAGRLWDRAKNTAALGRVARALPWPVYLAGESNVDCPHGVTSLGLLPHDALHQWMACAAIYVAPAYYEPFGLSILEAARAGCALVLGDIPSLREVWADAATYVPPGDHAHLAETLRRLSVNPALRQQMAEKARLRARRYSSARMAANYLLLYQQLLTRAATATPMRALA